MEVEIVEAYDDLIAAIFKLAVLDDSKELRRMIKLELEKEDERIVMEKIEEYKEDIKKDLQDAILKEARNWPDNKKSDRWKMLGEIRDKYIKEMGF